MAADDVIVILPRYSKASTYQSKLARSWAYVGALEGMCTTTITTNTNLTDVYCSGTSSLLLTMLRFLELDSGTIFIDGVDIRTVPRDILRERFATVAQDPFIIADSVRMNIDPFGKTTGDSEIITTLPKVHLWSLIESRGGVDTHMKDQLLSQGQRQLFSLARAIVNRGSILVLDEATSNVDAESDKLMQQVIKEEFRGRTMISVAHRLDTILDSDVVVLLESGKVREMGRPADLLELPGSGFRELYERQRRE